MTLTNDLARALVWARTKAGMSQGDVERADAGFARQYISRVEGGYVTPNLDTLERLCGVYGMKTSELIRAIERHQVGKTKRIEHMRVALDRAGERQEAG